ncbi:MAG: hypothetical protein K0S47_1380 [Herbinix sp.]|jgi:radical SAM-linked protein|nr:hypothetical protein [Herbinix sp.]
MKARIKFQKYGPMKFIGHLDVMRYFQKVFRRANVAIEYTKGFSPHQIMSFASPLGVGLTSDSEYLDAQFITSEAPEIMLEKINAVLTDGFYAIGFTELREPEPGHKVITAMSLVSSADYLVSLKDGYSISDLIKTQQEFKEAFEKFLSLDEIVIGKKTKKSEQPVDIKPMITMAAFDQQEYEEKRVQLVREVITSNQAHRVQSRSQADCYENGIFVYLQVATGSANNLKPELVMEAFYEFLEQEYQKFAWQVHRLEVYTREESGMLVPLDQLEQ